MCNEVTIPVLKSNAVTAHKNGNAETKKTLEILLGKQHFVNALDILKSDTPYEDACMILGKDPIKTLPYSVDTTDEDEISDNNAKMAKMIVRALNEGTVFNYADSNQKKWWAYMKWDASVSAFRFWSADFYSTFASAGAGARPYALKTEALAKSFATHPPIVEILNKIK